MKHKNKAPRIIRRREAVRPYIKVMALLFALVQPCDAAYPCSAVYRKTTSGNPQLGGNFDWNARGGILYLSPRLQVKSGGRVVAKKSRPAQWSSRYASLTLSQFGRDYPMQGINEAGLAGAVLMAPAQYPETGPAGNITENLWLQFQLDQFSSVGDVVRHAGDFGIDKISADLHWILCDRTGECATIEYIGGRPQIYRSLDARQNILTNSPYGVAWQSYLDWSASSQALPQGYQSTARFIRLASSQNNSIRGNIEDALDDVALSGFTAWQTVFDLSTRAMKVRVEGGYWEHIGFNLANLDCRQQLPMYELGKGLWTPYDGRVVGELLERATWGIPKDQASLIIEAKQLSETISCSNSENH